MNNMNTGIADKWYYYDKPLKTNWWMGIKYYWDALVNNYDVDGYCK